MSSEITSLITFVESYLTWLVKHVRRIGDIYPAHCICRTVGS